MSRVPKDLMHSGTLCTAHKRNGEPCGNYSLVGSSVCRMHGGAAPQVKRRAQQRILEASDKAAYTLVTLMQNPAVPPAVQLAAARDLLDRAGLTAKQELTVGFEKPAWQRMIEANVTVTDGVGPIVVEVDYGDDDEDVVDAEVVEDAPPAPPERVPQAIEIPPLHLRKPRRRIRP